MYALPLIDLGSFLAKPASTHSLRCWSCGCLRNKDVYRTRMEWRKEIMNWHYSTRLTEEMGPMKSEKLFSTLVWFIWPQVNKISKVSKMSEGGRQVSCSSPPPPANQCRGRRCLTGVPRTCDRLTLPKIDSKLIAYEISEFLWVLMSWVEFENQNSLILMSALPYLMLIYDLGQQRPLRRCANPWWRGTLSVA
jgi:hypothetical protein